MITLFTALEIPQLVASRLTALQSFDEGAWDAGWVPEENFHVTLAYIGPVEEPLAADIDTELARIRSPGFELRLKGVAAFGGKRPQVLYAAVERNEALLALAEKHFAVLRRLGLSVDARNYTPHVTLARPRHAPPERVQAWIAANNLYGPIVGHVGDGNFHVMPLFDSGSSEERAAVRDFLDRLVNRALSMGGTCSGEHGVGQGKIRYLPLEHGQGVEIMIAIKKALDPLNILNPGKIFALP